jgi:hypothetical protein
MTDVVLSTEDLTVFGGPVSLNVDVDFGPPGPRGSRIYGVAADPRIATTEKPADIQNFDIAMVITPDEPDFLTVYQKTGTSSEEWIQFASLVPNVFSTKVKVTFTDGIAVGPIPVSDLFTLDPDQYTTDNFMVNVTIENENPLLNFPVATGISLTMQDNFPAQGKKTMFITVSAAELNPSTGWGPVSGERIGHIFITSVSEIMEEVDL